MVLHSNVAGNFTCRLISWQQQFRCLIEYFFHTIPFLRRHTYPNKFYSIDSTTSHIWSLDVSALCISFILPHEYYIDDICVQMQIIFRNTSHSLRIQVVIFISYWILLFHTLWDGIDSQKNWFWLPPTPKLGIFCGKYISFSIYFHQTLSECLWNEHLVKIDVQRRHISQNKIFVWCKWGICSNRTVKVASNSILKAIVRMFVKALLHQIILNYCKRKSLNCSVIQFNLFFFRLLHLEFFARLWVFSVYSLMNYYLNCRLAEISQETR